MTVLKRALSVVMSSLLVLATSVVTPAVASVNAQAAEEKSSVIYYTGNYYDVLGGLESLLERSETDSIISDLRALIGYSSQSTAISTGKYVTGTDSKHPSYSGTGSTSLARMYEKSDRLENDTQKGFRLFYTNDYTTTNNWNREHVWPKSKSGGLYGTTGGGNDLHHIRPTYDKDNSKHGSFPYGNVTNGKEYYCNNDPDTYVVAYIGDGNTMEVVDEYKGDIARIYAYMVTHYATLYNLIDDVLIGGYDTLVEWNNIDPVDGYEINRNNVAYEYQGNRNPFIDCPDLINVVWGDGASGDIKYDSDVTTDTSSKDSDNGNTSDSPILSDNDTSDADYMTLKEVNAAGKNKTVTLRGQVTYIYGGNTVILEEVDKNGNVEGFQIYDKAGVDSGKYPLNSVVELTGTTSEYYGILQIKSPSFVKTVSTDNEPIAAQECTISELNDNLTKLVVLRNITLGEYDSTNTIMTDENGAAVNCFMPASYPDGMNAGDVVDLMCVAYLYKGEVQIRVANTSDYCEINTDTNSETQDTTEIDTNVDTEEQSESDTAEASDTDTDSNTTTDTNNKFSDNENTAELTLAGDINGDNKVTMIDVVISQKYIAKLFEDSSNLNLRNADIDRDGEITLDDVVHIQRIIAKV